MNNSAAIVTGASRGIGKAVAKRFVESGYSVTLVSNEEKEMIEASRKWPQDRLLLLCGDLTDMSFVKEVVDRSLEKWGRLDILVNNAAWRTVESMRHMTLETWEKTLRICLTVPAFLAKWSASVMERNGGGTIVNISSIMSERAAGTSPAYIACKGALLSLTYELAALYGPVGIRVVAVKPGNVKTQMSQDFTDKDGVDISERLISNMENATPLQRSASTDEIAGTVLWLCSPDASFITGTSLTVDGGFTHNFDHYRIKRMQFPNEF